MLLYAYLSWIYMQCCSYYAVAEPLSFITDETQSSLIATYLLAFISLQLEQVSTRRSICWLFLPYFHQITLLWLLLPYSGCYYLALALLICYLLVITISGSYGFDISVMIMKFGFYYHYILTFGILVVTLYHGTWFYQSTYMIGTCNLVTCSRYGFRYSYWLILQIYIT